MIFGAKLFLSFYFFGAAMEQRRGGLVPLSPSQAPRSGGDKPPATARDLRSADGHSKYDKDKGVNVQVLVRCRLVAESNSLRVQCFDSVSLVLDSRRLTCCFFFF